MNFDCQSEAYQLFRFEVQENKILEEFWTPKGWEWDKDALIVGYLSICEPNLDEINEDLAKSLFPQAFGLSGYRVHLEGSSIFCTLFGLSHYEIAQSLLSAKVEKGNLECFRWWCKQCEDSPIGAGLNLDRHVIKVSLPNVLKILSGAEVVWHWKEPESDWAISQGDATKVFNDLVSKKSRPNWVIQITGEPGS